MSTTSSLKGRLGARAPASDERRRRSGIPVDVELQTAAPLARPVGLARALRRFGLDLAEAHDALDGLKARSRVRLRLYVTDESGALGALEGFGVTLHGP